MIKTTVEIVLICLICLLHSCKKSEEKKDPQLNKNTEPNIVLIMADDMGFSDIGCYGSEIETPNLDKLASEGMRLKECYNNAICAPSRTTLLTGQYPHKAGLGFFNQDLGIPGYEGFINKESLTFGEVFKTAGYQTFLSGKWHVGNEPEHWPMKRGFDKFFGFIDGAASYFDTKPIVKIIQTKFLVDGDKQYHPMNEDFYLTDKLTDRGIGFLKERDTIKGKPFFLYMAYNAPHWPLHAKPKDIAKYNGKYDMGWDSLRVIRYQKEAELGLVLKDQKISKDASLPEWNSLSNDEKENWANRMEVYAAMVDNLDQNIGKLISYLKSTNQLDNTLIVFVSDNGADDMDLSKLPIVIQKKGALGGADSNESYTKNWAQLSNVPLRNYKASPYEGGISSPFIARLPKMIPANSIKEGAVHFVDFLPTLIDMAGINYPKTYNNVTPNQLPGESFKTLLKGEDWNRVKPICFEWSGHRFVRKRKWKIVSNYPINKWELYDLSVDRSETKNLAQELPAVVEALEKDYQIWASQNGVVEWNPEMQKRTGWAKPKD